jgi:cytochrome b561
MVGLSYYDRWYHDATQCDRSVQFSAHLKRWERLAARSTHVVFLLMIVLIPSTGYLISTSAGDSIMIFEWFEVPALFAISTDTRDWAISIHYWLAYGVALLVLLHAAAIKHQFADRDGALRRMLW